MCSFGLWDTDVFPGWPCRWLAQSLSISPRLLDETKQPLQVSLQLWEDDDLLSLRNRCVTCLLSLPQQAESQPVS